VRVRTRAAHAAAALSAIVLVGGFTVPQPESQLGVDVDDLVGLALAKDGEAPVVVRLREQAEADQLRGVADTAVDSLVTTVTETTSDLDGLLAALTAPVQESVVAPLERTVDGAPRGEVDVNSGRELNSLLSDTVAGALGGLLGGTVDDAADGPTLSAAESPSIALSDTLNSVLSGNVDAELARSLGGSLDEAVDELARIARVTAVVDLLQGIAADSTGDLDSVLAAGEDGGTISDVQEFWVFNGFAATVDEGALSAIAEHPEVASVHLDEEVTLSDAPTTLSDSLSPVSMLASFGLLAPAQSLNWGADQIGASRVWDEYGVRGEGVVVGIMDSGVDGRHPALADSWRGKNGDPAKSWFVATGERYPTPGDGRGHGTHITGVIVGEEDGYVTGIAPDAQWIAAKIFSDYGRTTVSAIHRGFEWMLAPGGDPSAAPDVVNNSWGTSVSHDAEFWSDVDAWIAAGIVPVFATGNRGPRWNSVSSPASYPQVIAVGASDAYDRVASFSSRGPVVWAREQYSKPDVVAPGYRIRSSWPTSRGGGYRLMTGTSMATPHAAGVIALIRSADPDASVAEARRALKQSARPGQARNVLPDNTYGYGIIDAPAALARITG
jgi:hypothetical protein